MCWSEFQGEIRVKIFKSVFCKGEIRGKNSGWSLDEIWPIIIRERLVMAFG